MCLCVTRDECRVVVVVVVVPERTKPIRPSSIGTSSSSIVVASVFVAHEELVLRAKHCVTAHYCKLLDKKCTIGFDSFASDVERPVSC